jgi:HSP20 family protein
MSLIRWKTRPTSESAISRGPSSSGHHPIARLHQAMDRLFDRFLHEPAGWRDWNEEFFSSTATWNPSVDVAETDNEITVKAEIPGADPSQITVSVSGNELTIAGHKKESRDETGENAYYCERRFGSFRRTIELPPNVNADSITADTSNGVLTVHVPRSESAKRRLIEVKPGAGRSFPTTASTTQPSSKRVPVSAA